TSAGGINAFCFAQHPNAAGLDHLKRLWCGLSRKHVFPLDFVQIMAGLGGIRDGLVVPDKLRSFLDGHVGAAQVADTKIPVHLVATDLADGQPVVLSDGPAVDALMASSAIPGVFPPVWRDDRPLVDGGVSADVPVHQAEDLGSTMTYVLPTVGPGSTATVPRGAVPVLLHALSHMFGRAANNEIAAARHPVHVLPAPAHASGNPFDFGATETLIEAGYQAASEALATGQRDHLVA
ncbi:MAG TPA: patatin-like phospholipase family protein, partial [Pseudonocardiaceae bacterium]|nr:patatin-like phospholipase family protein [Pseudonocardiaceae bacterium]